MPRRVVIFILLLLPYSLYAQEITEYVELKYASDGTSVTIDYSTLLQEVDIDRIYLETCTKQPSSNIIGGCGAQSKIEINNISEHTITTPGLYRILFKDELCPLCYPIQHWSQYIVLFENIDDASLMSAIDRYSPVYSFHNETTEYYPVSIETLFERQFSDYSFNPATKLVYKGDIPGDVSTADFMATNGHSENQLFLSNSKAIVEFGDFDNFPVYWFGNKIDADNYWVTYFVLFAYDKKHTEYIKNTFGLPQTILDSMASRFSHELDRESITVKFSRSAGRWKPSSVVYAGHFEDQLTKFIGCKVPLSCDVAGEMTITEWEHGKTEVLEDNISTVDGRPVVYVAHGSHAHTPGFGFYDIDVGPDVDWGDGVSGAFSVVEESGNPDILKRPSEVIQLDLGSKNHQALTFSGFLIPSPLPIPLGGRVHPFVRFPTSTWAENAGTQFNDCVSEGNRPCEEYINTPETGVFEEFIAEQISNFGAEVQAFNYDEFISINDNEFYLSAAEGSNTQFAPLYYVNTALDTYSLIQDPNGFVPYRIRSLVNYESNIYFLARDEIGVDQLWEIDNLRRARKVNISTIPQIQPTQVLFLTALEDVLIVGASSDEDRNFRTYYIKSPGSDATKTLSKLDSVDGTDICTGGSDFKQVEDRIYFFAADCFANGRSKIWSFTPNAPFPKAVPIPGVENISYTSFDRIVSHNQKLYFTTEVLVDGELRRFLHMTDGIETTQLVEIPVPEKQLTSLMDFISIKNKLFMSLEDRTLGVTDGTVDGTVFFDGALTNQVFLRFGYDYGDYLVTLTNNEQLLIVNVDTLDLLTVPWSSGAYIYNGELYYFLDGQFKRLLKDLSVEDIPWPLPNAPLYLTGRSDGLYVFTETPTGTALFRLRE